MAVINLIEEDIIKIPLEAKTKPDVIKELVSCWRSAPVLPLPRSRW